MHNLRSRIVDERGFSLIELLVVIAVIGVLATIAIPTFLNESSAAVDVSAKDLAHNAQLAAETYGTEHGGSYVNLTQSALNADEPAIPVSPASGTAWVSAASGTASGYAVTTTPASGGQTYTITRALGGGVTRSCTPAHGVNGGCNNGTW